MVMPVKIPSTETATWVAQIVKANVIWSYTKSRKKNYTNYAKPVVLVAKRQFTEDVAGEKITAMACVGVVMD